MSSQQCNCLKICSRKRKYKISRLLRKKKTTDVHVYSTVNNLKVQIMTALYMDHDTHSHSFYIHVWYANCKLPHHLTWITVATVFVNSYISRAVNIYFHKSLSKYKIYCLNKWLFYTLQLLYIIPSQFWRPIPIVALHQTKRPEIEFLHDCRTDIVNRTGLIVGED